MVAAAMLEGLPPNCAAHVMRLTCAEGTARRIADIIVETFDPATTAAAAFEEARIKRLGQGSWIVEAYFGASPDEQTFALLSPPPRVRPPPARQPSTASMNGMGCRSSKG
jgi:hypothetical protein